MSKKLLPPIHPGEILKEEFMVPLKLSANKLASLLNIPTNRITAIVNGERAITTDTAFRLAKCFGTSVEFWMNMQSSYEMQKAKFENILEIVEKEVKILGTA
jgi:addiction module HigA family antidote